MSRASDLQELLQASEDLVRTAASRQAAEAAQSLRRRGLVAERLLRSGPVGAENGAKLKASIEAGRRAALTLQGPQTLAGREAQGSPGGAPFTRTAGALSGDSGKAAECTVVSPAVSPEAVRLNTGSS